MGINVKFKYVFSPRLDIIENEAGKIKALNLSFILPASFLFIFYIQRAFLKKEYKPSLS